MLDKIILEKSALISYSKDELSNIASTSNHLRDIIRNKDDFNESFIAGSYKRHTMVKGVSDVDIYYQYNGGGSSKTAVTNLLQYLKHSYLKTNIKKDEPSILVDFERIPFNITPFIKDKSNNLSIPNENLTGWKQINFGELETDISKLRQKNSNLIELIKILKLWNFNYERNLQNFDIEIKVCKLFQSTYSSAISDWIWTFFNYFEYKTDANRFFSIMKNNNTSSLKTEWLKFIDNK
jgi:hypothetical protein